jgi:hypothetical protein
MEEGVSTDATIVLVHGLAIVRKADHMLTGVAEALQARGYRTARTFAQGDGSLLELAERHWQQLERIDGPLVLLCHSMGGLQARTFLLDDARARRLRGIATLGSPHAGTSLTWFMAPFQRAYRDMTPAARAAWIARHGQQERDTARQHAIRCVSAVASLSGPAHYPQMLVTQALLQGVAGANDGLVPAMSQRWAEHAFEVDLDHIECAAIAKPLRRARSSIESWIRLAELATAPMA